MNFDKVKALCKKEKTIVLYNAEGCQWLGDSWSLYPLYEHPEYNKETIASVLSLDDKAKQKMHFILGNIPDTFNTNDAVADEQACGMFDINFSYMGESFIPLRTSKGIRLIRSRYIAPIINDEIEFYERKTPSGDIYIAAKRGLLLEAIIMPINMFVSASLAQELYNLAESASEAVTLFMKKEDK